MVPSPNHRLDVSPWDEEHVKALLRFPRFPIRLIQQEPWQSWIGQRGGLKAVYAYLKEYPLPPSHRRILEVVLSNPESVSDVYAERLNISRATYFYQLRQLIPALVQALNEWPARDRDSVPARDEATPSLQTVLPVPVTPLVGHEGLLQSLMRCLQREEVRLITLLGPGGIGKTRLAIELIQRLRERFDNQIGFVDLSTLQEPARVAACMAQSLGLKETGSGALITYLRQRAFLLVLDHFEHLLPARALIAELLATAPNLKILITSRVALHLYGEHEFVVPPLALPAEEQELESIAQAPAIALFVQRAQEVNPSFLLTQENLPVIVELCRRMEGIPLAIELAASLIKYFSPQGLLIRLASKRCLEFLSQAPRRLWPTHQQTLRDMLDHSYTLLTPELQTLLHRLAIFPAPFTMEAAEAVVHMPSSFDVSQGLASLMDQSWLTQCTAAPGGEPRFHMLGILREYALEKLETSEDVALYRRAHARYYLHLAERFAQRPVEDDFTTWAILLEQEYVNLRAAIQWAIEEEPALGLPFVVFLWDYWRFWGDPHEGRLFAQLVLEHSHDIPSPLQAQILRKVGWLACDWGDYTTMMWAFQRGLEIAQQQQNREETGLAWQGLGELARLQGQKQQARTYFQQSLTLFQELQATEHVAQSWAFLGLLEMSSGNLDQAENLLRTGLRLCADGANPNLKASLLMSLGQALFYQSQLAEAFSCFEQSMMIYHSPVTRRDPFYALILHYLGETAIHRGDAVLGREMIDRSLHINRPNGYNRCLELNYFALALLALQNGDDENAGHWLRESLLLQQLLKEPWRSLVLLETAATLLIRRNELLGAARLYGIAAAWRAVWHIPLIPVYRSLYAESLQRLQEQLNTPTLDDAWYAGQSLSLEQAIAYALRCLE